MAFFGRPIHTRVREKVTVGKKLGAGAFGTVFEVQVSTPGKLFENNQHYGKVMAMKIIRPNSEQQYHEATAELKIFQHLNNMSEHVVNLFDFFIPDHKEIYLFMELYAELMSTYNAARVHGGDLFNHMHHMTFLQEDYVREVSRRLFSGIAFLHSKNIIHRDIKPDNILIFHPENPSVIKITDFGLSSTVEECRHDFSGGTLMYMAPELFKITSANTNKIDVWAAGITVYYLLVKIPPWRTDPRNVNGMIQEMQNANFMPTFDGDWNDKLEAKEFLCSILKPAMARPSAKSVLASKWLNTHPKSATRETTHSHFVHPGTNKQGHYIQAMPSPDVTPGVINFADWFRNPNITTLNCVDPTTMTQGNLADLNNWKGHQADKAHQITVLGWITHNRKHKLLCTLIRESDKALPVTSWLGFRTPKLRLKYLKNLNLSTMVEGGRSHYDAFMHAVNEDRDLYNAALPIVHMRFGK